MIKNVLLVDDDQEMLLALKEGFTKYQDSFSVLLASDGQVAAESLQQNMVSLVVTDLKMPRMDGIAMTDRLKTDQRTSHIPVIMLTARASVDSKIEGLETGADDYVTKPFHKAELVARVKSIIRRRTFDGNNTITLNDLKVDINASVIYVNDAVLNLTRKEYDLLLYFIYNKNRVLTKESIAEHLWGDEIDQVDNFDFIYNHVKNLRKKISVAGGQNPIRSVYGMGYKIYEL